jgi:hypothetical protein
LKLPFQVLLPLLAGASALVAQASTPADWERLHDLRLRAATRGDGSSVIGDLESLLASIDASDPLRGEVAWALAKARMDAGRVDEAREALRTAQAFPQTADAATAFDAQLEAIQSRIDVLPLWTDFSDSNPFVHAWQRVDLGTVSVEPLLDDPALRWVTNVRDRTEDQILVSFDERARPVHGIRCNVRGQDFPSFLRVVVTDDHDREFASDPFLVGTGSWRDLEVTIASLHHTDPTRPRVRPDPRSVATLAFDDVTAYLSGDRGEKEVWLDDLEIW